MFAICVHKPNVPIGLALVWTVCTKPNDCICGGSRHMKWISLFWCTIRHPISTVSQMYSDITFKRMRHYIVRSINLIRLFGFLWSQRKKCLLLQYNVLSSNHNTYSGAHVRHLAFDCEATLWNLHKPIFAISFFWLLSRLVQWEFSKWFTQSQMRFHFKKKQNKFNSKASCTRAIVSWQLGKFFLLFSFVWNPNRILREREREKIVCSVEERTWGMFAFS